MRAKRGARVWKRGRDEFCIKIKILKKTKKVVYISANCTYNVNIKKLKKR